MPAAKHKILLISALFHPETGGTENECRKVAEGLKSLGYEISVLTAYREGFPGYEVIDGVNVYRYIKSWHLYELTYSLSVLTFLIKNRQKFDIVICFGLYLFTAAAVIFARLTGRKIFFRVESARHTGDFIRISKLKLGKFVLFFSRLADGAIAITREIEQELLANGFSSENIIKIPNSVDTEKFYPARSRSEAPFIVSYVGRLVKGKGLEVLIKAVAVFRQYTDSFKVFIVGDGELKNFLVQEASRYNLQDFISFTGKRDDVLSFYHRSHVMVLPSFSEGMPLSLLEAMASGLCIIGTPVGGIIDLMEPYIIPDADNAYQVCRNGIMFSAGSETALAEALLKVFNDQGLRDELGCSARHRAEETYSLKKVLCKYTALFEG